MIKNKQIVLGIASLSLFTTFSVSVPNAEANELSEQKSFYSEEFGNYIIPFTETEDGEMKTLSEK